MNSSTVTSTTRTAAPVARSERSLAPDLARGFMLLFIALANAGNWAFAGSPGLDPDPTGWFAKVWNFVDLLLIDARAYPVFALMFGYGLVQLAHRQRGRGADPRRILVRRNAALVVLGAVHGTLLYFGDFLGAYGIVGLVATFLLVRRSERFHRIVLVLWGIQLVSVAWFAFRAVTGNGGSAGFVNSPTDSLAASSYGSSLMHRLAEWPAHTLQVLPFIVIVWLGMWAASKGILEHPERHRKLLRLTAAGGLGIAVAAGLPYALAGAGVLHASPDTIDRFAALTNIAGEYAGPGYVALFGLLAIRLRRSQPVTGAIAALGQRSLSGYLFQSVCWMAVFAPFALDWGHSDAHAVLVALTVWLVSVAAAAIMQRRRYAGPAERLLRKFVYGSV
ncbi:MAG TPA: DUF418 domain-containing protein [Flexivirga sp.]|uniref:DUF418 domain-containing protein n=1 Tax=Flexivirga sp. TaxID=1962927 RepID=UPI002CEE27FE|nr:DUF418 domain-containing protein [Flexivirga sp.]HWC21914.1 DUF418 domain-containing protein [Flexivirga sp.]